MSLVEIAKSSSEYFDLVEVWRIDVELGPDDDDALRTALNLEIGLAYGTYDHVSFEGADGRQHFRGRTGTASGAMDVATSRCVRRLGFSIPQDRDILCKVLGLIHQLNSYEEPVVYIAEAVATRTKSEAGSENPRKWWNRR